MTVFRWWSLDSGGLQMAVVFRWQSLDGGGLQIMVIKCQWLPKKSLVLLTKGFDQEELMSLPTSLTSLKNLVPGGLYILVTFL